MINAECRMREEAGKPDRLGLGSILHSAFRILHSKPLISLGLLTLLAGLIRFFRLSYPPLWFDESMVFWRTCGSYGQLLDCLRTDGFVPLHYSLVWVLCRFFKLTPTVLRFFPALCGTLMVPAVYFLARQMLPRTTAQLAAALTACSAFMLFYSRDAKMYMDAWLFVTLNAGCLLWWFRTKRSTAWLCWIASGCAACGLHASSGIPVGLSFLLLMTQRTLRWQQTLLWLAGVILIFAGPIGYYEKFNRWQDNVDEMGWQQSQLEWVNAYNYGRTGPQLARFLGTTLLMGWEWPKDADLDAIPPARVEWPARGAELLAVILIAGCLPWPARWRGGISKTPVLTYAEEPDGAESQWRIALWLGLWIVLPVYGFYCRSMPGFAAPTDWWQSAIEQFPVLDHHAAWMAGGAAVLAWAACAIRFRELRRPMWRALGLSIVAAVVIGLSEAMALIMASIARSAMAAGKPWESLWVPRYIGFVSPMLVIVVAALLMRLPGRWVRRISIGCVIGLNLAVAGYRIFGQTEPPVDQMAADAFEAEDAAHHTLFWTHLRPSMDSPGGANIYGEPGQYYLQLLENRPTDPEQFRTDLRNRQRTHPGLRGMPWDQDLPSDVSRIICWNQYDSAGNVPGIEPAIPEDWKLESEQWYTARDCWIWKDLARYRRSVYLKTGG